MVGRRPSGGDTPPRRTRVWHHWTGYLPRSGTLRGKRHAAVAAFQVRAITEAVFPVGTHFMSNLGSFAPRLGLVGRFLILEVGIVSSVVLRSDVQQREADRRSTRARAAEALRERSIAGPARGMRVLGCAPSAGHVVSFARLRLLGRVFQSRRPTCST